MTGDLNCIFKDNSKEVPQKWACYDFLLRHILLFCPFHLMFMFPEQKKIYTMAEKKRNCHLLEDKKVCRISGSCRHHVLVLSGSRK